MNPENDLRISLTHKEPRFEQIVAAEAGEKSKIIKGVVLYLCCCSVKNVRLFFK